MKKVNMSVILAALDQAKSSLPNELPESAPLTLQKEYASLRLDIVRLELRALKLHEKLKKKEML